MIAGSAPVAAASRAIAARLPAKRGDESTIIEWLDKFTVETDHGPGDVRSYTQAHVANKTVFIWDDDGPKTTALWAGLTPNGVRIGFVYTPPEFRGKSKGREQTSEAPEIGGLRKFFINAPQVLITSTIILSNLRGGSLGTKSALGYSPQRPNGTCEMLHTPTPYISLMLYYAPDVQICTSGA